MIYTENLDELIFNRHQFHQSDELLILSGYLGPHPVSLLDDLPLSCKVIYGMYGTDGIKSGLHSALRTIQDVSGNLNIYYSQLPVHSKCYAWRDDGKIIHALIGSANFSTNGLRTPYREVLAEMTVDSFGPLNEYMTKVLNNSISCLEIESEATLPDEIIRNTDETVSNLYLHESPTKSCTISLVGRDGEVQQAAGLNWGQSITSHVTPNDAYIAIRTEHIRNCPLLFPAKQEYPTVTANKGRSHRNNDYIEIIWDDGTRMEGLLEGSQPIDDVIYPKQISSAPAKSDLGQYMRHRIGVPLGQPVRRHHLDTYGRHDIKITLLEDGIYSFDFSV